MPHTGRGYFAWRLKCNQEAIIHNAQNIRLEIEGKRLRVLYTPYSPEYVGRIKLLDRAKYLPQSRSWEVDVSDFPSVRNILKSVYGYDARLPE